MTDLMTLLQKEVGKNLQDRIFVGDSPDLAIKKVPCGIAPLDLLLGGGFPRGRFALIYGDEGHGKSHLAQRLIASFQRQGLRTVYVDAERTFDPVWGAHLGIHLSDKDTFLLGEPRCGEEAVDLVTGALKIHADLVILDSVAACIPSKQVEGGGADILVAPLPRLMNPAVGRWLEVNENSCLVLINQIRDSVGSVIHEVRIPGGRAQGFHASLKIRVRRRGWIAPKQKRVGFPMFFRIEKTKIPDVVPWSTCEIPFMFDGSLDEVESLVNVAIEKGIIFQDGARYYLDKARTPENSVYGRNKLVELFRESPEMVQALLREAGMVVAEEPVSPLEDSQELISYNYGDEV